MHVPVLLKEVIELLSLEEGDTLLDGTLGRGGHSKSLAESVGGKLTIVALDQDERAIEESRVALEESGAEVHFFNTNFRHLDESLEASGVEKIDGILLDLGVSSDQLDSSGGDERGFSFQRDEPLLMSMKREVEEGDLTAEKILNTFSENSLELILRGFGEEKLSRKIARAIVERREKKSFKTTFDLVEAVESVKPRRAWHKTHPATQTFQALRIAVNEELTALEEGLKKGFAHLSSGGRFAVISFHSLEDRIVKNFFREKVRQGEAKFINKKPIVASEEERKENPRSRSAKLRVIEKN